MNGAKFGALVLEDEWPARNFLVELLQDSGFAEVVGAVGSVEEARAVLDLAEKAVDIAFIDVHLVGDGERAGLDLVQTYSKKSHAPAFVLATAFSEHAIEAFDLGVVDYLVKPFTEERVQACLERIVARRAPTHGTPNPLRIVARRGKSLVFLEVEDIWAFEAAQRLTYVHTRHGRYDLDLSLASVEKSVGRGLTRVHRNWMVHLPSVKELGKNGSEHYVFVGDGLSAQDAGIRVPVARDRAVQVRDALLETAAGVRR